MKTNRPPFVSANGAWPRATAVVLTLALGFGLAARAGAQTTKTLSGHVPSAVANLAATGRVAAETKMRLSIGLPLHNREALTNLLQELYDPASPSYRHYVSVDEFTSRFGPTAEDYQKVVDFAASRGLAVEVKHPNRMLVEVTGRAADIEKAFQVTLREYRHPTENRTFYAPDKEPTVDAGLAILHVAGMDNYMLPQPMVRARPADAPTPASGSGPGGNYVGKDFRAAYVPGTTLTGAGQSVGLLEYAGYYASDILAYESNFPSGLSNVPLNNVLLDGISSITNNATGAEQPLDIEMAISMAPGLTQVIIYYGSSGDDILSRMASDNIAKQLSASWLFGIDDTTLQIFQEFVAQGQDYFNASGDGDAYYDGSYWPCDVLYITAVGGTTLTTSGAGGTWVSETAWNWGGTGTSGGVSVLYALPAWQKGISMTANQGSTTMRNVPDVALTADGIWVQDNNGGAGSVGGTSCATPLWAGFLALANEQAASNGLPGIGFINPAVYAIGKGKGSVTYAKAFHDITTGNNTNVLSPTKYFAVTGYDLCTGWGTPTGTNLINALAGIGATNILLYAAPVALTMTAGGKATVLLTESPMNTANSSVSLSISNLPSGVTASFRSSSTTSTSILTLTAATNATTGTNTLTITGTTANATNTATVNLTVLAPAPGATNVSLSSYFNATAIYNDGSRFSGGFSGSAFSANMLPAGLSFNGCVFNLGLTGVPDVVRCGGQSVTLPSGQYSALNVLATSINGWNQINQPFVVNYTDGTSSTFIQSISSWTGMIGYPGENLVSFIGYVDTSGGSENKVGSTSIYGYSFALNPNKTVKNIKLPVNSSLIVLAMSLASDFSLYPSPFAPTLTAGGREVVQLNAAPRNGLTNSVALSITNLSTRVTASFSSSSTTNTSLLTLVASTAAWPSNSQVMVTGSSGGVTHSFMLGLDVLAATPGATTAGLSSEFNCVGLSTAGVIFSSTNSLDGKGNCYSSTLLGTEPSWNGSVFSLGTANTNCAVKCSGQTVSLTAGQFPVLLMLGAAVNANQPGQTFTVTYTDGAVSTFTQSLSAWTAANHYAGEAVAASMAYMNTSAGTSNTNSPVNLYGYAFSLDDTKTVQSVTFPNNTNVVVLALSLANAPWPVSLSSYFNAVGIALDDTTFTGGADNNGQAYSSNLLGAGQIWNSTPFKLGPSGALNIVRCAGQTISLPPERETQLYLLASAVNANEASQTFTVTYTNGTTSVFSQSLSIWTSPQSYAGESVVDTMSYRDSSAGSLNNTAVNIYGYTFNLDNTRVAQSLTLPNNSDVVVLAVTVKNGPVPVPLASAYNLAGINTDGTVFTNTGGIDGYSYSANHLGSNQFWNNMFFGYGPINASKSVVSCAGQTITLPTGQFTSLSLLATGVNGAQANQSFKVTYTNNAYSAFVRSLSDWVTLTGYSGQTLVISTPYLDTSGGGYAYDEGNVYGYTFNLDYADVVQSITLPANANVIVLAMTLSNATTALTEAPSIATQPQSLTVTNGGPATFSVAVIGTPTLSYHWQFNSNNLSNGGIISGSTTSNLTLSATTTSNSGSYTVVVSNSAGSVTSSPATLTVLVPATIVSQPVPLTVTNGQSAMFSVTAAGNAPLAYQWQFNNNNLSDGGIISGSSASSLTLSATTTNNAGAYTVVVTNSYGSVISSPATLTVLVPPTIVSQPVPLTVINGHSAVFSVGAAGTAPLIYQWQFNNNNLSDGGEISGSSASSLTLSATKTYDAGNYRVVVSNLAGSAISSPAALTVVSTFSNITLNYNGGAGSGAQVMQSGNDWNTPGYWWDGSQDGGLAASTLASEYPGVPFVVPPGSLLLTPAGASAALFPGGELDLDGDGNFVNGNPGGNSGSLTTTSALDLQGGANAGSTNAYELYFTNLVINGGQIDAGVQGVGTLDGAMTIGPSNACFYTDTSNTGDAGWQVNSVLSGAGTIELRLDSYYSSFQPSFSNDLDIAGVNNPFTGAWLVTQGPLLGGGSNSLGTNGITVGPNGALETLYNVNNPNASLTLNGMMYLDQADTFQTVTVNGASLYAGTYTAAQLNRAYPATFPATWNQLYGSPNSAASGTLTVLQPAATPPALSFTSAPGSLTLIWSQGVLMQATNLAGPWVATTNTSPCFVAATNCQMYFQVASPLLP